MVRACGVACAWGCGVEEFWKEAANAVFEWLRDQEPWIKPISLIVSPILAGLAFYTTLKTRARMDRQSKRLGMLKKEARQAQELAASSLARLRDEEAKLTASRAKVQKLEDDLRRITDGGQQLWKLRDNKPFDNYREWYLTPEGAKVVTFGNLKGGVGKTTLAANFGAYLSQNGYKVLLIDLDYQGSLSNGLMLAANYEEVESRAEMLLEDGANLVTLERAKVHLTPVMHRGWLVPASYPFAQAESRLLMQWLLPYSGESHQIDVRYRLAHALLRPEVRNSYDVIVFDMPPRMSIGAVNALVASHHFVVPTILDKLSIEAISQFLSQMKAVKSDLGLGLDLAGIVPTMTLKSGYSKREIDMLGFVADSAKAWSTDRTLVLERNIPKRTAIARAAGEGVAYNLSGRDGDDLRVFFDPLFAEILTRIGIKPPDEHLTALDELRTGRAQGKDEDAADAA